jgi:cysteinyl-tRNA synthetase
MLLKLTNTLTKKKEVINLTSSKPVLLYVCGITPYDYAHIGHGRVYVNFDTIVRLLQFLGHTVSYVRNITDIDDKLINKAVAQGDINKYTEVAEFFTAHFQKELQSLNCLTPTTEPRATQCIPEMIDFISGLIEKKHAYVVGHDVYFDITSFPGYGKLSGRNIDDLMSGARVEVDPNKRNPADFALWKGNSEDLFWKSPWGYGRPGWHIECSVMAKKHLGSTIDIHGGGMDLIFPHHENEIAQSECFHQQPFAHHWVHNAFVNINKEKMSKSLGNIISLRSIFEQKDPMVLRYFYLQHHYKSPIDYSDSELDATQVAYKKLITYCGSNKMQSSTSKDFSSLLATDERAHDMLEALCDDLNTPKFLGLVFENLSDCKGNTPFASFVRTLLQQVLGLTLQPLQEKTIPLTPEFEALIKAREQARKDKNWALADKIRDELVAKGYQLHDKKA